MKTKDLNSFSADILASFLRPISKYKKPGYALFEMLVKKRLANIKTLKHCENLLKVSIEITQYV